MTPQELKLLDELFDRLASLESAPRDPDAVRAINEGLQRAPNALYPLVQTALVQDEALKQADARIRELEAELGIGQPQPPQQGGFLDSMRDTLMGKREQQDQRGSVPSVRSGAAPNTGPGTPQSPWRNTTGMQGGGYRAGAGLRGCAAAAAGAGHGAGYGRRIVPRHGGRDRGGRGRRRAAGEQLPRHVRRRPGPRTGAEPQRVRLRGQRRRQPVGRQSRWQRSRPRCRRQRHRRQRPHGGL